MKADFLGSIVLKGKMECLTGLHIGGSKEKMEIGSVDSPVLRDPNTNMPYVPGSSLKGRMRALLSYALGVAHEDPNPPKYYKTMNGEWKNRHMILQRVFGTAHEDRDHGPTRLYTRDAFPDAKTIEMWKTLDSELLYTEYKPENSVDRLTSMANPRFIERVVKGSVFNVEFVYGIYDTGDEVDDADLFPYVVEALRLLELSALGKSVSRGYGQVAFRFRQPHVLRVEDYRTGSDAFVNAVSRHEEDESVYSLRLSDFTPEIIRALGLPSVSKKDTAP